jgi:hypothetical protein
MTVYPSPGQAIKNPPNGGFFQGLAAVDLFDLGFLVHHVLADRGIEFLDLHFARLVPLVLGRGVEMSSAGTGYQFDFVTHGSVLLCSDFFAAGAHFAQDRVYTLFVDDAHAFGSEAQPHPAILALDPESVGVQIGQKTAFGLVVRVGNVVSRDRALAGNLADF